MQYPTYCDLADKPHSLFLPTMDELITKIEQILDYEFEASSICRDALVASKKQSCLANLASLPNFGGQDILAQAAKDSGIASLFRVSKKGGVVSGEKNYLRCLDPERQSFVDGKLATTVKALLGAIMDESQDENYVLHAAFCLGFEEVVESAEVVTASECGVDLLGVKELTLVQCARVSIPVVESLI
ncbi:hypothetical protein E8E12_009051 [Didymella heteroderae]|uniref:Uncharacterized protein n=1 Tax=Didymella heteroderae TaxID=1769908 RepID=A0A9P4WTE5_9PLEO|nr:hypothetical protein E8E12_009051 [Didymella heteroderae]